MTMLLPDFTLHRPATVAGAVALLKEHGPENCDFIAGGTDILPNYKCGLNAKPHVISLRGVAELKAISGPASDGRFTIGAGVPLSTLAADQLMRAKLPVLAETAGKIASVLLQGHGTLGGNLLLDTRCHFFNQSEPWRRSLGWCLKADGDLCHVVPKITVDGKSVDNRTVCYATNSSDLVPVMIVLGASFHLAGPEGDRVVAAKDFYKHDGIKRFDKKPGELLVKVSIPKESARLKSGYAKLRPRESWDFPVLGVAAALSLGPGGEVADLRLAVNAVDTVPVDFTERLVSRRGSKLSDAAVAAVASEVAEGIRPKLNVPMRPAYRRKMAAVFTRRLLTELRG